ncbi:MAG TPA: TonB family protein [Pyrinomonadaceae bacterium]|nr:TonB family protein [Pyrinomonadaceae bacterium]
MGDPGEVKDPFSGGVGSDSGQSADANKNQPESLVSQKTDSTNPAKVETQPLAIVTKPKPGYTDGARNADVQGSVTLRVVFLANGGIGSISPVKTLPLGLTEQAIAAAMKIAFLPQKRNGVPVTVVKTIEYKFSIY